MHPLARPGTNDKLNNLSPGDRVVLDDGRRGTMDQAVGGQAYVSLDSGDHVTVFGEQMSPERGPPESLTDQIVEDIRWPDDFRWNGHDYERTREPWC